MSGYSSAYDTLLTAFSRLAEAEAGNLSSVRLAVFSALNTVLEVLGAESVDSLFEALAEAPTRVWADVIRLLELKRLAEAGEAGLDEAREAVEIATAVYSYLLGER